MEHKRDIDYDDPKDNTAFECCIDVMSRLMLKYGPDVLDKIEREKCGTHIAKKWIMCYDTHIAMRGEESVNNQDTYGDIVYAWI